MDDFFLYDQNNILNKQNPMNMRSIEELEEGIEADGQKIILVENLLCDLNAEFNMRKLKLDRYEFEIEFMKGKIAEHENLKQAYGENSAKLIFSESDIQGFHEKIKEFQEAIPAVKKEIEETQKSIDENIERKRLLETERQDMQLLIKQKKFALPESNKSDGAIEITNRTTYKRLPNSDTVAQLNRDQFIAVWNKVWNRLNVGKNSNIFSEVDVVEVTEMDIRCGKILSMDGRIYREVEVAPFGESETDNAITNVEDNDYYVKLSDGNIVGYNSRKRFLFYLQNILSGLNAEREFLDNEPDVELMSELVIIVPKIVKCLPLYIYNSTRLVNILENSLFKAFAKLREDKMYSSYGEQTVQKYIDETKLLFEERKELARTERRKRR